MIKLVASDIDGTILPLGDKVIPQQVFDEAGKLVDSGIAFCFASGRQYENLKKLAMPLLNKAYFMCENGAVLFSPGENPELISETRMERQFAMDIAHAILEYPDADVFISGRNMTYLCLDSDGEHFIAEHLLANNLKKVPLPEDVQEPIVKVSAFCPDAYEACPVFAEKFADRCTVSIAGSRWVDFTIASKGSALRDLCSYLGIGTDEAAAFGDNFNDLPMLEVAGVPYIMENADSELKKRIPNHCSNVVEELRRIRSFV